MNFKKINKTVSYFTTGGFSYQNTFINLLFFSREFYSSCKRYNIPQYHAFKKLLRLWGGYFVRKYKI